LPQTIAGERAGGFDPRHVPALVSAEDRHFWFVARNAVIAALATQIVADFPNDFRALDAGCGTGATLRALQAACGRDRVFGMDLFSEALSYARRRSGAAVVQADLRTLPFPSDVRFHLVAALDVIEHLVDDLGALRDLRRLIAMGGALLLTVPADPTLWSSFDEAAHHCRRYTAVSLRTRLSDAGYDIEYLTPFMTPLYPLMWIWRRSLGVIQRHATGQPLDDLRVIPGVNEALRWMLACEPRMLTARRQLPFGTSLVAIARPATSVC
jgi:SAM-dependent methyltransferase